MSKKKRNLIDYVEVGERIRAKRIEKNYTQEQLAEKANVSLMYISNIEKASSSVGLQTLVALANALDVGIDYLLMDSLTNNKEGVYQELNKMIEEIPADKRANFIDIVESVAKNLKDL